MNLSDKLWCNKSEGSWQKFPPYKICWPTWGFLSWSQTTKNAEKLRVASLSGWHHSGAVCHPHITSHYNGHLYRDCELLLDRHLHRLGSHLPRHPHYCLHLPWIFLRIVDLHSASSPDIASWGIAFWEGILSYHVHPGSGISHNPTLRWTDGRSHRIAQPPPLLGRNLLCPLRDCPLHWDKTTGRGTEGRGSSGSLKDSI